MRAKENKNPVNETCTLNDDSVTILHKFSGSVTRMDVVFVTEMVQFMGTALGSHASNRESYLWLATVNIAYGYVMYIC